MGTAITAPTLSATITGPTSLQPGVNGTFTATATGGVGPYSYRWFIKTISPGCIEDDEPGNAAAPCNAWTAIGGTTATLTTMQWQSFELMVEVTAQNGAWGSSPDGYYVGVAGPAKTSSGLSSQIIPETFELKQNYPNPFNPSTVLRYGLPRSTYITLKIYNLNGQEITTLVSAIQDAGYHDVVWDGRDKRGMTVSSGVYLYRLEANGITLSAKMILLK